MLLIDKPYVSDLLIDTIKKNSWPVVGTPQAKDLAPQLQGLFQNDEDAVKAFETNPMLYVNSENTISWINEHLAHTKIPDQVNIFKNKGVFRDMLHDLYPEFKYRKIDYKELRNFDPKEFGYPLIIKPAVGFFSMGIYVVENRQDWDDALFNLEEELQQVKGIYPDEVMNDHQFLLEQLIPGDEYAVDIYFDKDSKPVILNIYEHIFTNAKDVNDRAYFSSIKVIDKTYAIFEEKLKYIGEKTGVKLFPMHIEWRITPDGEAIPIESNPLRFAGWCMADMTRFSWRYNPYEYFFNQQKPNWDDIFSGRTGKQFNVIIADIPRDIPLEAIDYVDYRKFEKDFSNLLHIHKTNYREYPVFAFAFSETRTSDKDELAHFLHSDLTEYIVLKS